MRFVYCAIGVLLLLPVFGMQIIVDNFPATDSATLEKAGLRGPVKTMRSYLQKGGRLVEELTFDRDGRLVQEINYHVNRGQLLWTHNFEYDAAGRLVRATSSGEFVKTTGAVCTFAYDGQGNKIGRTKFDSNGKVIGNIVYSYDDHGRLLTVSTVSTDENTGEATVRWIVQHRYNANGDEIEQQYGGAQRETRIWSTTYGYFPDRKIQRRETDFGKGSKSFTVFSPEGKPIEELFVPLVTPEYRTGEYRHKRYTYTDAGEVKEETGFDETGRLFERMEHDYNADGKESERRYFRALPNQEKLTLWFRWLYRYNENGWKVEQTDESYDTSGFATQPRQSKTYRWTYDAYGNAIDNPHPRAMFAPVLPPQATYRAFTYYE